MDFFGDYTIELASYRPINYQDGEIRDLPVPHLVSPTSYAPGRNTISHDGIPVNMSDLARVFNLQTLDLPSLSAHEDILTQSLPSPTTTLTTARNSTTCTPNRRVACWKRRAERQCGVRMQTDDAHLNNIEELVQRMVKAKNQCEVFVKDTSPVPATPSTVSDHDVDELPDSPGAQSDSSRNMSTSSNERPRSYTGSDHYRLSYNRRSVESGNLISTYKDSKVQKREPRRGGRR